MNFIPEFKQTACPAVQVYCLISTYVLPHQYESGQLLPVVGEVLEHVGGDGERAEDAELVGPGKLVQELQGGGEIKGEG